MKKFFPILLVVFLAAVMANDSFADMTQNFKLINHSGMSFQRIWIRPSSNRSWRPDDIVNMNPLEDGWHTIIYFSDRKSGNIRYWDLLIDIDIAGGQKLQWNNIDLLEVYEIEIDKNGRAHYSR